MGRRPRVARFCAIGIALLIAFPLRSDFGGRVWAQPGRIELHKEVTPETVNDAIRFGIGYLHSKQKPDGSWADFESPFAQPGAITALVTLALLNCGEKPDEPHVKAALDYLERHKAPGSTYATSLHIMAFCQADPLRYKLKIASLALWLEAHQVKGEGATKGGWSYTPTVGIADNSNTQFAMLAMHEAERVGVKISDQTWQLSKDYWLKNPVYDKGRGAWGYHNGVSGSMTCAAIASLIIAEDRLANAEARVVGDAIQCCGMEPGDDEIGRGIDWLGRNFTVRNNPGDDGQAHRWLLYYLYAMERVGRMSGRRFFFGKPQMNPNTGEFSTPKYDWYREGCEVLLSQQDAFTKCWSGMELERDPLIATPLALLFLSKGRRPVVVARLQTSQGNDWNHHRRSLQNLVGRVERQWRRDLSWQTYELKDATVADLLEAPVLFLSGTQALNITDTQKKTLREYVNQGGFLFIEACDGNGCNGAAFDQSVRAMLKDMFKESQLRKLPPDHAVWHAQQVVQPKGLPQDPDFWLWGLDSCCRTGVVYCPKSLSCYWELAHPYREANFSPQVKEQIEQVCRIGGNVLAYATNRQLKEKLEKPQIALGNLDGKTPRGALTLPKLAHTGGADDAPNALQNLLTVMDKQLEMKVDYERRRPIAANEPKLLDYPLLFAHGRQAFQWSPAERRGLKTYLDRGGFLFADAICASEEFAASFKAELLTMYPNAKFTRLPASHPIFTDAFHGFKLDSVKLRDPQFRDANDPLAAKIIDTSPFLEALEIDERIAVILSPYDLSCALEKGASLECKGYLSADAARIGANIILYALQQ